MSNVSDVITRAFSNSHSPGLADAVADAIATVLEDLRALLFPEQHPGYDPDHQFWASKTDDELRTFAARRAKSHELWEPVAALYKAGRFDEAARASYGYAEEVEKLGDVDEFQWDSETIELVASRIEALRAALAARGVSVQ